MPQSPHPPSPEATEASVALRPSVELLVELLDPEHARAVDAVLLDLGIPFSMSQKITLINAHIPLFKQ